MITKKIDDAFISHASDILADTKHGLSGPDCEILQFLCCRFWCEHSGNKPISENSAVSFLTNVPPCTELA